ncbi:metallophosphoesterase [bacterium]|nr:metallophosphoesterase [bacterium]QQR59271.1 MAG: metallophosphoesterase [Candidatus Melainabacteria bacterium]
MIPYITVLTITIVVAIYFLYKFRDKLQAYWEAFFTCAFIAIAAPFIFTPGTFWVATAWCIGLFCAAPVLCLASAIFSWNKFRATSIFFAILALVLPAVAYEAFVVEPDHITVRHETLFSQKITKPTRIVVLADIQTDVVAAYERGVLERAMQEKPDMIVMPGDYIQTFPAEKYFEQGKLLNQLFKDVKLSAPLGVYVCPGDMEWTPRWSEFFKDLPVTLYTKTQSVETPDFTITGLTLRDSRFRCKTPESDKFHIVFGHAPDFSLDKPNGDLYIAGHTHGGQVQLPFIGPLVTFTDVPRKLAGGCFANVAENPDKYLMISRGIGRERNGAPQIRFLCYPEIVVIDLKPSK